MLVLGRKVGEVVRIDLAEGVSPSLTVGDLFSRGPIEITVTKVIGRLCEAWYFCGSSVFDSAQRARPEEAGMMVWVRRNARQSLIALLHSTPNTWPRL